MSEDKNSNLIIIGMVAIFFAYLIHSSKQQTLSLLALQNKQLQLPQNYQYLQSSDSINDQYLKQLQQISDIIKIQNRQIQLIQEQQSIQEQQLNQIGNQNNIDINSINNNLNKLQKELIPPPKKLSREEEESRVYEKYYIH